MPVPAARVRVVADHPVRGGASFVLYWMIASRRLDANFALQRAVELARDLRRPLIVLEALRCDYPWASDRLHGFAIDGMAVQTRRLAGTPVTYLPYVEPSPGAGRGLLAALARDACAIVTDDYPCFFLPSMIAAAASRTRGVRLEAVDANGLVPMRAADRAFTTAHAFRAYLQRTLRTLLSARPEPIDFGDLPRRATLDPSIARRWPMARPSALTSPAALLARLPIDHAVPRAAIAGGSDAAATALAAFVSTRLERYAGDQRHPDAHGTSGLSPYLHFGHIGAHQIFDAVMTAERWTTRKLAATSRGAREGWWGVRPGANAFLDQLITWRELGLNACVTQPGAYATLDALPRWAAATLARHRRDRRTHVYSLEQFAGAATHDPIWNAAQRQLVRDGWMHNYLRMLWGKKILEWTRSPADALEAMTALMDRYALDGRDPNSSSGYLWTLGKYDRAWGPERPVFGTVRYMSSESTRRKVRLREYLARYGR